MMSLSHGRPEKDRDEDSATPLPKAPPLPGRDRDEQSPAQPQPLSPQQPASTQYQRRPGGLLLWLLEWLLARFVRR